MSDDSREKNPQFFYLAPRIATVGQYNKLYQYTVHILHDIAGLQTRSLRGGTFSHTQVPRVLNKYMLYTFHIYNSITRYMSQIFNCTAAMRRTVTVLLPSTCLPNFYREVVYVPGKYVSELLGALRAPYYDTVRLKLTAVNTYQLVEPGITHIYLCKAPTSTFRSHRQQQQQRPAHNN